MIVKMVLYRPLLRESEKSTRESVIQGYYGGPLLGAKIPDFFSTQNISPVSERFNANFIANELFEDLLKVASEYLDRASENKSRNNMKLL